MTMEIDSRYTITGDGDTIHVEARKGISAYELFRPEDMQLVLDPPEVIAQTLASGNFEFNTQLARVLYPQLDLSSPDPEIVMAYILRDRISYLNLDQAFFSQGQHLIYWQAAKKLMEYYGITVKVPSPSFLFAGHLDFVYITQKLNEMEGVLSGAYFPRYHTVCFDSMFLTSTESKMDTATNTMFLLHEMFEALTDTRMGGGYDISFDLLELKEVMDNQKAVEELLHQKLSQAVRGGQRLGIIQRGMEIINPTINGGLGNMLREGVIQHLALTALQNYEKDSEIIINLSRSSYHVAFMVVHALYKTDINIPFNYFVHALGDCDMLPVLIQKVDEKLGEGGYELLCRLLDYDKPPTKARDSLALLFLNRKINFPTTSIKIPRAVFEGLTGNEIDEIAKTHSLIVD